MSLHGQAATSSAVRPAPPDTCRYLDPRKAGPTLARNATTGHPRSAAARGATHPL